MRAAPVGVRYSARARRPPGARCAVGVRCSIGLRHPARVRYSAGARYLAGVQPSSSAVVPREVVRRVTTAS